MSDIKCCSQLEVFKVEIENIKEEMDEFKTDIRNHLKEARQRENANVETMRILSENVVRLTTIAENQEKQLTMIVQNQAKQDKRFDVLNNEIQYIKASIDNQNNDDSNDDRQWYQKMIQDNGSFLMKIILIIISFILGVNVENIPIFNK